MEFSAGGALPTACNLPFMYLASASLSASRLATIALLIQQLYDSLENTPCT